jgi:hypothetical protein
MICTTIRSPKPDFFSLGKLQISEMQTHGATLAPIARSSVAWGRARQGGGGTVGTGRPGTMARVLVVEDGGGVRWVGRRGCRGCRGGEGRGVTNSSYRRRFGDGGLTGGEW